MVKRCFFLLFLFAIGCSGQASSPPSLEPQNRSADVAPQGLQSAATSAHWVMYRKPTYSADVESWPIDDGSVIAYGDTCCHPDGVAPEGFVRGITVSGTTAPVSNANPPPSQQGQTEAIPVKLFHCGTQICTISQYGAYAPNNQVYYGNNQYVPDATAGAGDSIWFTVCCSGSYIVYGNAGSKHYYRIPNTKDHLNAIARTADGNVWVTLQHIGTQPWTLAKLNPSTSQVTEFPRQFAFSPPQLFVGPDGNVWFAGGKTLYRVSRSNAALTRFALPEMSTGYVAAGPNNTIWTSYVNSASSQGLIELSLGGAVLGAFACPATICTSGPKNDRMLQLTQGPDGNIWFAFSNTQVDTLDPSDMNSGIGVYKFQ